MLLVNLPMPTACVNCPVRMECKRYLEWLVYTGPGAGRTHPNPKHPFCLIKGETEEQK